jgi:hypothetical protein
VFWSKIWFFLTAVIAAAAITIALMLPRPAARQRLADERQRVITACDVINILLGTNARSRVDLAGTFARSEIDVSAVLAPATLAGDISAEANQTARTVATQLLDSTTGDKPDFVILVDGRGRVVARVGIHDDRYGDALAGYFLVDDALDGYVRDDLWLLDETLYLVAGAPVIGNRWAGAVIIGHAMDKELADRLVGQLGVHLVVYAGGKPVATTNPVEIHSEALNAFTELRSAETPVQDDCRNSKAFDIRTPSETYTALVARLPGEAGQQGAFFSVFIARPATLGLGGTLKAVSRDDISFGGFPWIWLGLGLIAALAAGVAIMIFEADRPLRRLSADAVKLAQAVVDRLDEERHRGHYGSIARSVNIYVDKVQRDARAVSQQGMAPLSAPPAPVAPAFTPPPPSEFKFTDSRTRTPVRGSSALPGAPPPPPAGTAPPPLPAGGAPSISPMGSAPPPPAGAPMRRADLSNSGITAIEDVLAPGATESGEISLVDDSFRALFEEFIALKRRCGESTAGVVYEKFAGKMRASRDSLMAKHGCDEVRFHVYVRDGKAAVKAKPVLRG